VELPCASADAGSANAIRIAPNNVMRLMRPFG
jgi:hypothetical protein